MKLTKRVPFEEEADRSFCGLSLKVERVPNTTTVNFELVEHHVIFPDRGWYPNERIGYAWKNHEETPARVAYWIKKGLPPASRRCASCAKKPREQNDPNCKQCRRLKPGNPRACVDCGKRSFSVRCKQCIMRLRRLRRLNS